MKIPARDPDRAPVLVLGIGNELLQDDGAGLALLRALEGRPDPEPAAELVDGGTQGIALVGLLAGRRGLLILDAVALGAEPGTVHVLENPLSHAGPRGAGAHEGNATELLAAATLLGDLPPQVRVVGIEPGEVRTGVGLSAAVQDALPEACRLARATLRELLAGAEVEECTS